MPVCRTYDIHIDGPRCRQLVGAVALPALPVAVEAEAKHELPCGRDCRVQSAASYRYNLHVERPPQRSMAYGGGQEAGALFEEAPA